MRAALLIAALVLAARVTDAADSTREELLPDGVRVVINTPSEGPQTTALVVYATPNGSSAHETLGRRPRSPEEWKYDAQHVLAQVRALRASPERSRDQIALAVLEAPGQSWPSWRTRTADAPRRAREMIEGLRSKLAPNGPVALLAHSGGGALIWAFMEAGPIPTWVERIGFLDANYGFEHQKHAAPLLNWLDGDRNRRLVVVAYDDRFVNLNGKPIVGPEGGTQRATARMRSAIDAHRPLAKSQVGDCDRWTDASGQVDVRVDRNYANVILHTALVGDMNGVLHALTVGSDASAPFGWPRRWCQYIEPAEQGPTLRLPDRPAGAPLGSEFAASVARLPEDEREAAIRDAALAGNVPDFLRQLRRVSYTAKDAAGNDHQVTLWVTPDVLSIGHDDDFLRVPVTLATAQRVAAASGCILPTPRISDEVWRAAQCKLQPRPLRSAREAWTTFVAHHTIIQEQRREVPNGPIVAGIKKDLVICRDLAERPGKLAIYGWHRDDGKPIQPLSLVHSDRYADYSHGVRLVWLQAEVDGQSRDLRDLLRDEKLAFLVSDEGPLTVAARGADAGSPVR